MKLFEGKSKTERNKIIAAMVLGLMCLVVLYFAFGRGLLGGSSTTASVKPSPTPKTNAPRGGDNIQDLKMPSQAEQDLGYQTTVLDYRPGNFYAPDPGRNIFAFYEPPAPTPYSPTPYYVKTPVPPSPTPTPPVQIAFINPQSIYAGSKGFRLEIAGDHFTPETGIYFNQQLMPTTFVSAQRLTTDIPGVLIASEGSKQVIVQTPDGKLYSNQVMLDIQPPPKPQFVYVGAFLRKRSNNDTAAFREQGKPEFSARLNDVVGGRFRLVSISALEVILEDKDLGFRHKLPLFTPPQGTATSTSGPGRPGFPGSDGYVPFNPSMPAGGTNTRIPGIPDNIPRYVPPASNTNRLPANTKKDVDDDDDEPDN